MNDVETLAGLLSGAAPQYVHLAIPTHMEQARRLLTSDWLAEHDRKVADAALAPVEALREVYDESTADYLPIGLARADVRNAIAQGRDAAEGDAS